MTYNCPACGEPLPDDGCCDSACTRIYFTDSDLIANISRGEEALKGIEPGETFDIADLYGKEN